MEVEEKVNVKRKTEAAALKRQILTESYPKNLVMAVVESLELPIEEFTQDIVAGINYALSTLDEREQKLIYLRYAEKKSLSQIGDYFGFQQERSRQIENRVLRKLRSPINWKYITLGVQGFTKILCDSAYEQGREVGYSEGYREGIEDAPKGITKTGFSVNVLTLPIECLELSKRAYNALKRAGYNVLGDIIDLDSYAVIHLKYLGVEQRHEVAAGLHHYGITDTDWDMFYRKPKEENEIGG